MLILRQIFAFAFCLMLGACARAKGGGEMKFLLPWRDAGGNYSLQEVTISTLSSPYELKGGAAEIYFQSALTEDGYGGSFARPHLTHAGGLYIPQDTESSTTVSVYAQMEHLYQFEQRLGVAAQVTWPRKVGVDLNLTGPDGSAHNNAHYFTKLDAMGLLPYTQGGVPVSLNHGIVAHELFHAHFQHEVLNALNHTINGTVSLLENILYPIFDLAALAHAQQEATLDYEKPSVLNTLVLRAWNEGLADFFAAVYTNSPDLFVVSLPQVSADRNLTGARSELWSATDLSKIVIANKLSAKERVGLAYVQGTVVARLFYRLAHSGVESPESFLVRVLSRLNRIPAVVNASLATQVLDMESLLPVLIEGLPLNGKVCAQFEKTVMTSTVTRSFAKCLSP